MAKTYSMRMSQFRSMRMSLMLIVLTIAALMTQLQSDSRSGSHVTDGHVSAH